MEQQGTWHTTVAVEAVYFTTLTTCSSSGCRKVFENLIY